MGGTFRVKGSESVVWSMSDQGVWPSQERIRLGNGYRRRIVGLTEDGWEVLSHFYSKGRERRPKGSV